MLRQVGLLHRLAGTTILTSGGLYFPTHFEACFEKYQHYSRVKSKYIQKVLERIPDPDDEFACDKGWEGPHRWTYI